MTAEARAAATVCRGENRRGKELNENIIEVADSDEEFDLSIIEDIEDGEKELVLHDAQDK